MLGKSLERGFTLIELLIAIVVIAILATISVVAYDNVQERAYNARVTSVMNTYGKALQMYHVDHGEFPVLTDAVCLGNAQDYPANDDFPAGACQAYKDSQGNISYVYAGEQLTSALNDYIGHNVPNPTIKPATELYTNDRWTKYRGIYVEAANYDNYQDYAYMEYVVDGNVTCLSDYATRYKAEQDVTFCSMMLRAG